jgi:hypothetical protein
MKRSGPNKKIIDLHQPVEPNSPWTMASASASVSQKDGEKGVVHVKTDKTHGLMMTGDTLKQFKSGLSSMLDLANECVNFSEPEPEVPGCRTLTTSIKLLKNWVETNSISGTTDAKPGCGTTYDGSILKTGEPPATAVATTASPPEDVAFIGSVDAYELGWAIGRCLSSMNQLFEFFVARFTIPKTLAEWKTGSDKKCNDYYAKISTMVSGLTVVRGYIEEIRMRYPFFQSILPAKTNETPQKPTNINPPPNFQFGVYVVDDPSHTIIGDCHPEFWMTDAQRNPFRAYIGSKRNCSNI